MQHLLYLPENNAITLHCHLQMNAQLYDRIKCNRKFRLISYALLYTFSRRLCSRNFRKTYENNEISCLKLMQKTKFATNADRSKIL